jgi:hypothetical protein
VYEIYNGFWVGPSLLSVCENGMDDPRTNILGVGLDGL